MQNSIKMLFFAIYLVTQGWVGWIFIQVLFRKFPPLLKLAGAFLIGVCVTVPATYLLSLVFISTGEPILLGTISTVLLMIAGSWIIFQRKKIRLYSVESKVTRSDVLLVVFSIVFSAWLMFKTFHGGPGGEIYVGSNNVFDFGHDLGIIRSFSWGNNIPITSPFQAGLPFFYHFFFYYWVAVWEYFGVPIIWALNIPSIISFTILLVIVYMLPQVVTRQGRFVGWLAVILTITHSTLTFWHVLVQKGFNFQFFRFIWQLPNYLYTAPFDNSMISIFMTLNNYVNQRHLAFATSLGLFIFISFIYLKNEKQMTLRASGFLGIISGLLFMWNTPTCIAVTTLIVLLLLFQRGFREVGIYLIGMICVIGILCLPYLRVWHDVISLFSGNNISVTGAAFKRPDWNILTYIWENLGILPFVCIGGYFATYKKNRLYILPFILFFILLCIQAGYTGGFNQKILAIAIIGINVVAAIGIGWLWNQKKVIGVIVSICCLFILTVSGFVDLMPVKNEFAYPILGKDLLPVVSWIRDTTPKNSVFVSYPDIIDPVVLAGRKNVTGFFGNIGWYDRTNVIRQIYSGDDITMPTGNMSYVLVPKGRNSNFTYIDMVALQKKYSVAFEDSKYVVFTVH